MKQTSEETLAGACATMILFLLLITFSSLTGCKPPLENVRSKERYAYASGVYEGCLKILTRQLKKGSINVGVCLDMYNEALDTGELK